MSLRWVSDRTVQSFLGVLVLLGIDDAGHIRAAEMLPAADVHSLLQMLVPLCAERRYTCSASEMLINLKLRSLFSVLVLSGVER